MMSPHPNTTASDVATCNNTSSDSDKPVVLLMDSDEEIAFFILLCCYWLNLTSNRIGRAIDNDSKMSGHQYTQELLHGTSAQCHELMRLSREVMSKYDNYGIPKSRGTSFPHEDDIPRFDRGIRDHASFPPPPPIILPNPQVRRLEKFKLTKALLASKHEEGKSVCEHILEMKSHIDRLRMLGSVVCEEMAVDRVIRSLPNSYSEFVREYYMLNRDVTLIDLTYMLIAAESAMVWRKGKAKLIGESTFQTSVDIGNGNERHAMIEKFDHKRKAMSEVVPCAVPKESICFYCQEKGHWRRSCPIYLRDLRDGRVKTYDSALGKIH
ncbi:hypothetical protein Lser_V15G13052 [Lactuca serriola]